MTTKESKDIAQSVAAQVGRTLEENLGDKTVIVVVPVIVVDDSNYVTLNLSLLPDVPDEEEENGEETE